MARALFFLVMIGLAVYAVSDIASSDDDERLGIPRLPWIVLAIIVPVLGPVVWIVSSRAQRARRTAGGAAPTARPTARPTQARRSGPLAPDDDPEFLWRLEQDRIRRERERQARQDDDTPAPDDPRRADGTNGDVPDDGARG